jgi:hypothetical protein
VGLYLEYSHGTGTYNSVMLQTYDSNPDSVQLANLQSPVAGLESAYARAYEVLFLEHGNIWLRLKKIVSTTALRVSRTGSMSMMQLPHQYENEMIERETLSPITSHDEEETKDHDL